MPQDSDKQKFIDLMKSYDFSERQAEGLYFVLYGGFDAEIEVNKVSTITCVIKAIGVPAGGPP